MRWTFTPKQWHILVNFFLQTRHFYFQMKNTDFCPISAWNHMLLVLIRSTSPRRYSIWFRGEKKKHIHVYTSLIWLRLCQQLPPPPPPTHTQTHKHTHTRCEQPIPRSASDNSQCFCKQKANALMKVCECASWSYSPMSPLLMVRLVTYSDIPFVCSPWFENDN